MTQKAVDNLQQGLLHAGKAFLQKLKERKHRNSLIVLKSSNVERFALICHQLTSAK